MKRKRIKSKSRSMMSVCLAMMLVLQTVMFSASVYAVDPVSELETVEDNETGSLEVTEPAEQGVESETGSLAAPEPSEPENKSTQGEPKTVTEDETESPEKAELSSKSKEKNDKQDVIAKPKSAIPMALTSGPVDKTDVFTAANTPFPLEVTQGDPPVTIGANGTIQGRQPFTLKSEGLNVPVNGDDANPTTADPTKYIQKGDWIELKKEDYFKEVVLSTATKTLMATTDMGTKKLGTAYFTPESIKIVFDGDDNFFNGVGRGVTFGFETTANSDVTGMEYGATKPINIFGGAYQLHNPDVSPAYSMSLKSNSNPAENGWIRQADLVEGTIEWQVEVSAADELDPTIPQPLDGKTFYNLLDPNEVGVYVEDSFKVNGTEATPDTSTTNALAYTFPADFGDKATITFKTWIPKAKYYSEYRSGQSSWQTVTNGGKDTDNKERVELRDESNKSLAIANFWRVAFKPDWIQSSATYDHASTSITWKVVVNNYNKKGLQDFKITNVLPEGLEFTSATWQTWVDGKASESKSITPDGDSVYSFGDIDGKVELVIQTKVNSGSSFRIDPIANWNLATPGVIQNNDVTTGKRPNAVHDEAIVTIGAHTFTKSPSVSMEDYNLGGITWTVNLTPQYALPDAVVYDVLIHGGDVNVLDNAVDATNEVDATTIAKIKANLINGGNNYKNNPNFLWKQYHKDSLKPGTNADGLTLKHIPLTVNGEVVADLIKVTGYNTDKATSFSFRSVITNPDILFRQNINENKGQPNRALLFDGEAVKIAENGTQLHYRMLNKDMLTASYPVKADGTEDKWYTPNNIHRYVGWDGSSSGDEYALAGYDQATKTVTFRLGVNMPGYNSETLAKDGGNRVISDIKLVDTLPAGWEFVPFSEEKEFELWKGRSDNGPGTGHGVRNNAQSIIEPNDPAHVVNFSHSGNVGTFTFSKL